MSTPTTLNKTDETVKVKDQPEVEQLRVISEDVGKGVERRVELDESTLLSLIAQLQESVKTQKESLIIQEETLKLLKVNGKAQEETSNKGLKFSQGGFRYARLGFWAAILIALITTAMSYLISGIQANQKQTQSDVRRVERQVENLKAANKPVITSHEDGGNVDLTSTISGTTPFIGKHHYIIVTPVEIGTNWIQNGQVSVEPDGSFSGQAQFGEGSNGIGKKFLVRILATNSSLPPGQLPSVPTDAIFSDAIKVTRQH